MENHRTMSAASVDKIRKEFGSVERAVFTLFRGISGGDWTTYYEMVSATGGINSFIFIVYISVVWLSVTNIITSVFVEKAMKLAQPEMEQLLLMRCKEDLENANELKALFAEMDLNASGTVNYEELQACFEDCRFTNYLKIKGLDIHDAKMFWRMLSSVADSYEIDVDSFVCGCLKMRGVALNIDLLQLNYETKIIHRTQQKQFEDLSQKLGYIHHELQTIRSRRPTSVGISKTRNSAAPKWSTPEGSFCVL